MNKKSYVKVIWNHSESNSTNTSNLLKLEGAGTENHSCIDLYSSKHVSTYTFIFFLSARVSFLIGRPYLHQAGGIACAGEVKVHLDWASAPSGSDVAAVEVVVLKQVVLDAQEIDYVPAGGCVCGRVRCGRSCSCNYVSEPTGIYYRRSLL